MNKILAVFGILLLACGFYYYKSVVSKAAIVHYPETHQAPASGSIVPYKPPVIQLASIRKIIAAKHYNSTIVFIADMRLPSSKNRFFVYDLKRDSVIGAGLVAHGRCGEKWLEGRRYSNNPGGMCTSLGNYKIGKPYYGRFGLAYTLHGLDSTNNKALERHVVLHAYECVPETEVAYEICQSDGCPMVSRGFLNQLQKIIDRSKEPILLSLYESK